ncbi:MAG TPA: superoxide dismutase [Desulfosporosinus sp.]
MSCKLAKLPYTYNALEPFYDRAIVKLHHDVHNKAFVDMLNNIAGYMEKNKPVDNHSLIKHLELQLAFRESGHLLHSIYWQNMCLGGSRSAQGILAEQINNDFGSFENFKKLFTATAMAVDGSGWTLLVWSPYFKELEILQAFKHQDITQWGVIPLLIVDVWEHAYHLNYLHKRANWVEAWWNLVNWEDVLKRFEDKGVRNINTTN